MENTNMKNIDPAIARSNAQSEKWKNDSQAFLDRFDDLDTFLEEAKIVVQYYFEGQKEIRDYPEYLEFLKGILKRYVHIYSLPDYEAKKLHAEEGDALDATYHKLINFGIFDPNEALEERIET